MKFLELRILPVGVTLIHIGLMYIISRYTPDVELATSLRWMLACCLFLLAGLVGLAGIRAFRKANTTVNPHHPSRASSLVIRGIYHYSRNPMYLAMALALPVVSCALSNAFSLIAIPCYILYMNRFQIIPEERALQQQFGQAYRDYCRTTRRWI